MLRALAKFIYFNLMGWKMDDHFPQIDKCVIAVVPHTSWWDFPLGLLVRKILGMEINYVGKKSLFKPPFGWFFRWTGGAPIDRSKSENKVEAVAQIFASRKQFRLALAPEGTRKKVEQLKTGFYYIARTAQVPIVLVAFDYGNRRVKFSEALIPTENMEADFETYLQFFKGVKGKVPDYSF